MASTSLLKASPVLDKSEWVKGQSVLFRQPSSAAAVLRNRATSLAVRAASSYADELVKTLEQDCTGDVLSRTSSPVSKSTRVWCHLLDLTMSHGAKDLTVYPLGPLLTTNRVLVSPNGVLW